MSKAAAIAAEANFATALAVWAGAADGGSYLREGGAVFARAAPPMRSFNNVLLDGHPARLDALVARARDFFTHADERWRLRVRADVEPVDDAPFAAAGLERSGGIPSLALSLPSAAPSSPPLEIRRVEDRSSLDDHISVVARGFDFDASELARVFTASLIGDGRWRGYVGYAGGEPAATSQLVLSDGAAGIYYVATIESMRGRGFGAALTGRAALDAAASGCGAVSLQASPMGLPVYERMGFRPVAYYRTYIPR